MISAAPRPPLLRLRPTTHAQQPANALLSFATHKKILCTFDSIKMQPPYTPTTFAGESGETDRRIMEKKCSNHGESLSGDSPTKKKINMTYTFIIAFILFGILLIWLYYIIENRKTKRFFSLMDNKQSEKLENISGREIERVGLRTYYNLSCGFTIFINGKFCAFVKHSGSLMKKFYIPIIITSDAEAIKEFDFLPCFNVSSKEIETGNNLKLLITNIKYPKHTKEITLSRLKESDLEKLKNI